jgi:hypothetical protein
MAMKMIPRTRIENTITWGSIQSKNEPKDKINFKVKMERIDGTDTFST